MKTVILISGVSGSGKDTYALELHDQLVDKGYNVQVLHNAHALYGILEKHYGVTDYKSDLGKRIIMGCTDLLYEIDKHYFEKITEGNILDDTDVVIIPDWRYLNTYEYFYYTHNKYKVHTVMIKRVDPRNCDGYLVGDNQVKERNLLHKLNPQVILYNKDLYSVKENIEEYIKDTLKL